YFGTKVEEIASDAGFSRSAIYLHFPDGKEGLYAEALRRAVRARHEAVAAAINASREATNERRVRDLWLALWRFRLDDAEHVKILSYVSLDDVRGAIGHDRVAEITSEGTATFALIGDVLAEASHSPATP